MRRVEVTAEARADIQNAYHYSLTQWGQAQADRYLSSLRETLAQLADLPLAWPAVDDIRPSVRRMVYESHGVYYRVTEDAIFILAALHLRQDPMARL
jgi:toxin ParE1/3/4